MALFSNGKSRITRLVIFELGCGILIMIDAQILGTLPSQDWLTPEHRAKLCFALGLVLVLLKGMEMFFSKTVSLFLDYDKKQEQEIIDMLKPHP